MENGAGTILEVESLGFRYRGSSEPVLRGLDFEIRAGEVFGFLGPNGSGKSTTQRLLARILTGFTGSARVFGQELEELGPDYFNRIGVCFEFPNLYERLTAEENLGFYAGFFDGPTEDPAEILRRLDLPVADRRKVGAFSKGMKMRLVLARSLLNRPQLWFLDEPTTGQDPEHAVMIRDLIRAKAAVGTTVFLTTHDMWVADQLCDRVAFLVDGEIALIDTPRQLKLDHARRVVRVELAGEDGIETREFALESVTDRKDFARLVETTRVETIHTLEPSLEDVFLKVTGRGLL